LFILDSLLIASCSITILNTNRSPLYAYYHSDHLGSSNVITDQDGQKIAYYEYTPYGSLARNEGTDPIKHKFTGKELDSTGLYFFSARYYDPEIGRFITPDIFVQEPYDPQTLNRYSYCGNNPINFIDPTGHFFLEAIIGALVGAAIGGIVAAVTGGDIKTGLISGAIGGLFFGIAGSIIEGLKLQGLAAIGTHAFAGAASGATSAAITGGDIGMSAAIGGFSAGFSKFLGSSLPFLQEATGSGLNVFARNLVVRSITGAIVGGVTSTAFGGDFGYGARQGAMTAAIAFTANETLHEGIRKARSALKKALHYYLYESALPGPYGQPMSEWSLYGPTSWGDLLKYTEEAGGWWKWTERGAIGIAAGAILTAGGLMIHQVITGIRIEFHLPHLKGPHKYPHFQKIKGPGWGKTIGRYPERHP